MADQYEMKDMTGKLFKNTKPKNDKSPPYNGRVKIEGKEYYMSGFVNEKKSDGSKYFGLTFRPIDEDSKGNDIGKW